jgi:phosphoserine phosphatase
MTSQIPRPRHPTPHNQTLADFKLVAFDMDSTLINIECVDEIATRLAARPRWRRSPKVCGDIDWDSLRQRVALLKASVSSMDVPGASSSTRRGRVGQRLQKAGSRRCWSAVASRFFTDRIRDELDYTRSNVLGVEDGTTGETVDQPWGDICDGDETQDGAGDLRTAGHLAGW